MYATFVPAISERLNNTLYHANIDGPKALFDRGMHLSKGDPLYSDYMEKIHSRLWETLIDEIFSLKGLKCEVTLPAPISGIYYPNSGAKGFFSWRRSDPQEILPMASQDYATLQRSEYAYYVFTNDKTLITAYDAYRPWFTFLDQNLGKIHSWLSMNPNAYDVDQIRGYISAEAAAFRNFTCPCVLKT